METTRIWKIQNNLLGVVNYAKDETKTENPILRNIKIKGHFCKKYSLIK